MTIVRLPEERRIASQYFSFITESAIKLKKDKESAKKGTGRKSRRHQFTRLLQSSQKHLSNLLQSSIPPSERQAEHLDRIRALFPQWAARILLVHANLGLVGWGGEKGRILEEFGRSRWMNQCNWFQVSYDKDLSTSESPSLVMHKVLCRIIEALGLRVQLPSKPDASKLSAMATELVCGLVGSEATVVLAIEYSDPFWADPRVAEALGILAGRLRLVLAFEAIHQTGPDCIWAGGALVERLNLHWIHLATFLPYSHQQLQPWLQAICEPIFDGKKRRRKKINSADDGPCWISAERAGHVLGSLNRNAQGIFVLLAEHILQSMVEAHQRPKETQNALDDDDEEEEDEVDGDEMMDSSSDEDEDDRCNPQSLPSLSFQTWYQLALERFLVSSELVFRTQLTEFIDHNLIIPSGLTSSSDASTSSYTCPIRRDQLALILGTLQGSNFSS